MTMPTRLPENTAQNTPIESSSSPTSQYPAAIIRIADSQVE